MPSAILLPLPEEATPLLERLGSRETVTASSGGSARFFRGLLGEHSVVVGITGDGPERAREGVRQAIASFAPSRVLVVGVAGGLSPNLELGSRVLVTRVFDERGSVWTADVGNLETIASAARARVGLALTSDHLATSPERKALLRSRVLTFASGEHLAPGALVVDLESAAMVAVAEEHGVPWLALRAVSDDSTESLPDFLEECRDEGGGIVRHRVAACSLMNPRAVPRLLELRKSVRARAEELASVVEAVLDSWAA